MSARTGKRIGLLGLPYDTSASLGWPGARYAPGRIRESLRWIQNRIVDQQVFDVESGRIVDLSRLEFTDFGDARISRFDHEKTLGELKAAVDRVFDAGCLPVLLGGDHCVSWPGLLSLHSRRSGPIGIIHLDAHLDLVEESDIQGPHSGSSEIRRALELPGFSGRNVIQIGVRGFNYPEHYHFIRRSGITLIPPGELFAGGVEATAQRALAIAGDGTKHIYLTVDIDVLDSAFAPGSGANEAGGLTSWQLLHFVRQVAPHVSAMDIVEVNPLTDQRDVTCGVAARLVFEFLAANAGGKSGEE